MQELHRLAEGFPERERQDIQNLTEFYARTVVEEGWPLMQEGRLSAEAGTISVELRRRVLAIGPRTNWEDGLYSQALGLVGELDRSRALRLLEVREGIPSIFWVVLVLGGATTVCCTYLLGVRTEWLHAFMIAAYTLVLALTLYTINVLDYPLDGLGQIGPAAFEDVLTRMESYRAR